MVGAKSVKNWCAACYDADANTVDDMNAYVFALQNYGLMSFTDLSALWLCAIVVGAQMAKEWNQIEYKETPILVGPGRSYVKAEPLGVVAVMSAWNYPFYTLFGPAH